MNEIPTYVIGNLVKDPVIRTVAGGVPVATMRVASTSRRFDRGAGEWVDGTTTFVTVVCWRRTAEHVARALRKGDPVIVYGRLTGRSYEHEGRRRYDHEIEAVAVAPDLSRVGVQLVRASRDGGEPGSDPVSTTVAITAGEAFDAAAAPVADDPSGQVTLVEPAA